MGFPNVAKKSAISIALIVLVSRISTAKRKKIPVEAVIARQLRVKGSGKQVAGARRHDAAVVESGQDLDALPEVGDHGRTNEYRMVRLLPQGRYGEINLKAVDLAAEGIAANADIHYAQRRAVKIGNSLGKHDRTSAGSPKRHAGGRQ